MVVHPHPLDYHDGMLIPVNPKQFYGVLLPELKATCSHHVTHELGMFVNALSEPA